MSANTANRRGHRPPPAPIGGGRWKPLTLERREATVQDELQIAELALIEHDSGESLCLIVELLAARGIARDQVLEDTACREKNGSA